jgi:hypothetical protein
MSRSEVISDAYKAEQERLHSMGNYGTASLQFGAVVSSLINQTGAKTLLDYGCGSMCNLAKVIEADHDVEYIGYDPAVEQFSAPPVPADLVCCIDVLEHIEPELLNNVLSELRRCVTGFGFFTVHTGPAQKTLSDGRNAHLIQRDAGWWVPKLLKTFELRLFKAMPNGFMVIVK